MRMLLAAAAAAALAFVPAGAASAEACQDAHPDLPGDNHVQTCSWREWEYMHYTYGCAVDYDLDGQADAACVPLFEVVIPG